MGAGAGTGSALVGSRGVDSKDNSCIEPVRAGGGGATGVGSGAGFWLDSARGCGFGCGGDCCLLGLTSQASSSNPELAAWGSLGLLFEGLVGGGDFASSSPALDDSPRENALASTTSLV
ncbi:hypothetical protein HG530_012928 [Fusarium avenaceum]|nr:hypothetical protein HG530_012928 [Fusarium avenaceum]